MGEGMLDASGLVIALADEGVPIRVIARATRIPSEHVRYHLMEAHAEGRLIELPCEDWPQFTTRAPTLDRERMSPALQQIFGLTVTQSNLLLVLLRHISVSKARLSAMTPKTVDVHIHRIRAHLLPFDIDIETIWGYGYTMPAASRQRIMTLLLLYQQGRLQHDTEAEA